LNSPTTRVDFYVDAENKFAVAARIAQKSLGAGTRLAIFAPDEGTADQIDRSLWSVSPNSFIAHAKEESPLASESPVVILQEISSRATFDYPILVNLTDALPAETMAFKRIIEIVTLDAEDKASARKRFKAYRELGCEMLTHRLGQNE
jgi:DNA polymerase III subunit chi